MELTLDDYQTLLAGLNALTSDGLTLQQSAQIVNLADRVAQAADAEAKKAPAETPPETPPSKPTK